MSESSPTTRGTGISGEMLARRYLEARGLKLRAANVRSPFGEIDLVMEDPRGQELVFVEVKTRRTGAYGTPEESLTSKKRAKLTQLVAWYARKVQWTRHVRLDVVGILYRTDGTPDIQWTQYVSSALGE